jgi:hypothetical protein
MAAVQTPGPRIFELTSDDTKITYAPGALDGVPRLHYDGPMGEYHFEGDEVQTFNSARGLEISVTMDRISHLRTITLTVFLPDLEFEDPSAELTFHTVGIHATRRRRMSGDVGGEMISEPLELEGLARNIEYHSSGSTVLL